MNQIIAIASIALALSGCCTGGAVETTTTAPVAPPVAPPGPAPAAGGPLPAVTVDGPEVTAPIPAMTTLPFTVATAAEYQIDATGPGVDAQLYLFQGDSFVTSDSDSGEGVDARIVTFLAPGAYTARIYEYRGRALTGTAAVTQLQPLPAAATISPGAPPTVVSVPSGDGPRASSAEITLAVTAPGNVRIDVVSPDASIDPELMIIQNGAVLATDSDSGEGTNAQLVQAVGPGAYTLRVRDWINRSGSLTVTVVPQ